MPLGLPRLWCYLFILWQSADDMDARLMDRLCKRLRIITTGHYSMRLSNDVDRSDPVGLSSLGVVDLDLGIDIVISNLSATSAWQSSRQSPGDVTSLRRRWPRILFHTMHTCQEEMETLCRKFRDRPEREFHQGHPGFCPQYHEYVTPALDRHMMNNHMDSDGQCTARNSNQGRS